MSEKEPKNSRVMQSHLPPRPPRAADEFGGNDRVGLNPLLKTFADRLKKNAKKPKQIIIAVMRKLLHQIYGIPQIRRALRPGKERVPSLLEISDNLPEKSKIGVEYSTQHLVLLFDYHRLLMP